MWVLSISGKAPALTPHPIEWCEAWANDCTGEIFRKLAPESLETLRTLRVEFRTRRYVGPPFGGMASELASIAHCNALEELIVRFNVSCGEELDLNEQRWKALDDVLSRGFPRLRVVDLEVEKDVFWGEPESIKAEIEGLFAGQFPWCREHVELKTRAIVYLT